MMKSYNRPPLFSVVIPTYNRRDLLLRAVRSVIDQSFDDFEVIVVDDCGSDDSESHLQSMGDSRIRYVRLVENAGAAAARNEGVRLAAGLWTCFLDSDDVWLKDRLGKLASFIASHGNSERLVYWSSLYFDRGDEVLQLKPQSHPEPAFRLMTYLLCSDGLMQTSTLALAADVARKHPFDESMKIHDDYSFLLNLERAGYQFAGDTDAQVVWKNDIQGPRVSLNGKMERNEKWLAKYGRWLSPKERSAYEALFLAPKLGPRQFVRSVAMVVKAFARRAIGPRRAALSLMGLLMPRHLYESLARRLLKSGGHS